MAIFETQTIEIIESLNLSQSQLTLLMEALEWEKELSWSNGYADAVDQTEELEARKLNPNIFGNLN
jgi:hypothetical protein